EEQARARPAAPRPPAGRTPRRPRRDARQTRARLAWDRPPPLLDRPLRQPVRAEAPPPGEVLPLLDRRLRGDAPLGGPRERVAGRRDRVRLRHGDGRLRVRDQVHQGMSSTSRLKTPACDVLGIEIPIVQAGMATYTSAELVAAVSNAGGLGIIGALGRNKDDLRDEIRRVRALTNKPFGVNHVVCRIDDACVELTLSQRVPVISLSWGRATELTAKAHA